VTSPDPKFQLRYASVSDAALMRDVMLRCWTGTVAANSSAYRETEATISQHIEQGAGVLLYDGDEAIGGGRHVPVPGPPGDAREWVEIKRVGVLKSHRKFGLGPLLVQALEDDARARGYAGGQLGVRADQPRLIDFWRSLGYSLASNVAMHTVNPLAPPPTTMRKRFT